MLKEINVSELGSQKKSYCMKGWEAEALRPLPPPTPEEIRKERIAARKQALKPYDQLLKTACWTVTDLKRAHAAAIEFARSKGSHWEPPITEANLKPPAAVVKEISDLLEAWLEWDTCSEARLEELLAAPLPDAAPLEAWIAHAEVLKKAITDQADRLFEIWQAGEKRRLCNEFREPILGLLAVMRSGDEAVELAVMKAYVHGGAGGGQLYGARPSIMSGLLAEAGEISREEDCRIVLLERRAFRE